MNKSKYFHVIIIANKLGARTLMNQAPEDSHIENNQKDMPKKCQRVKILTFGQNFLHRIKTSCIGYQIFGRVKSY